MKLVPFCEFPIRIHYSPGESLFGYIYRQMSANGHGMRGNGYFRTAKIMLGTKSVTQFDRSFETLRHVIDNEILMDRMFWRDYKCLNFGVSEKLMKFTVNTFRYCPECLHENGYHHSCWQVGGMRSCAHHGNLLSNICPECGRMLSWVSLSPSWLCRCGCQLTERTTNLRKVLWMVKKKKDPNQYLTPHLRPSEKYVDSFHTFTLDQTQVINLVVARDLVENMQQNDIQYTPKVGTRLVSQFVRYLYFWQRRDRGYQVPQNIDITFLRRPHKSAVCATQQPDVSLGASFCLYRRNRFSCHLVESVSDATGAAFVGYIDGWLGRNCRKLSILKAPAIESSSSHRSKSVIAEDSESKWEQILELLDNLLIVVTLGYDVEDLDLCKLHWSIPDAVTLPSNSSPLTRLIDYFMSCTEEQLEHWTCYLRDDLRRLESKFRYVYAGFLT